MRCAEKKKINEMHGMGKRSVFYLFMVVHKKYDNGLTYRSPNQTASSTFHTSPLLSLIYVL